MVEVTRAIAAQGQRVAFLTDVVPQEYLRQADLQVDFAGSVLDLFLWRAGGRRFPIRAPSWPPSPPALSWHAACVSNTVLLC